VTDGEQPRWAARKRSRKMRRIQKVGTEIVAGIGQLCHAVPRDIGRVVTIGEHASKGTEIYRIEGGFRFVSAGTAAFAPRCVLVSLAGGTEDLAEPYGCDGHGLALIGLMEGDTAPGLIIWDSAWEKADWYAGADVGSGD
jgi:hypothetical protein